MSSTEVELIEVSGPDLDESLLRAAFDDVLRPSFNTDELPGWDQLRSGVADPMGEVMVIARSAEGVVGAGVTDRPSESGITLLGYLATRPDLRSQGVGGAILEHLLAYWKEGGAGLVLAEVHDPRFHAQSSSERSAARLRFYERHGATVLDAPWVQPSLSPTGSRVPDMLLLSLHQSGAALAEDALRAWAELYFVFTEGDVPTDPQYVELSRRLAATDPTATRPLSTYESIERLSVRP